MQLTRAQFPLYTGAMSWQYHHAGDWSAEETRVLIGWSRREASKRDPLVQPLRKTRDLVG